MAGRKLQAYPGQVLVFDGDAAYDTRAEVAAIVQANTALTTFSKIWQKTVPAQQVIQWGYGSPALPRNQGLMHFMALDESTDSEEGLVRLVASNARETNKKVVAEIPSQRLHTVTYTTIATATPLGFDNLFPLPAIGPRMGEDDRMIIEFRTVVTGTTVDVVDFSIPCTFWQ